MTAIDDWLSGEPCGLHATADDWRELRAYVADVERMSEDMGRLMQAVSIAATRLNEEGLEAMRRNPADEWTAGYFAGLSHGAMRASRALQCVYAIAKMAEMTDGERASDDPE